MKRKCMRFALLFLLATALCSVSVLAAGEKGVYAVNGSSVTITPKTADGTEIASTTVDVNGTPTSGFYANAERFDVAVTGNQDQYLILVTSGDAVPTVDNIVYIDQQSGTFGATFNAYPNSLSNGSYKIYLASTTEAAEVVGSFQYYSAYTLGDVNDDGKINASDATAALLHSANRKLLNGNALLAANVNGDNRINASDATRILLYATKRITSF